MHALQKRQDFFSRKGFTLIELLVGIAIIVILFIVGVLTLNPAGFFWQNRDTGRLPNLSTVSVSTPSPASGDTLTFDDEFNSLDLAPRGTGSSTWYTGWRDTQVVPVSHSQFSVSSSVLSLDWRPGQTPADDTSITTYDLSNNVGTSYRYGYYEARMKWNVVTGSWPAFWLLALTTPTTTSEWGEIDIFEGQGAEPDHYFGTVNDWHTFNGTPSVSSNANNDYSIPGGIDYNQWHTYGVLWEPNTVTYYLDEQPIITTPAPLILNHDAMRIILGSQEGVSWTYGNMTGVTSTDINLSVDWVRVWQKNPTLVSLAAGGTLSKGQ